MTMQYTNIGLFYYRNLVIIYPGDFRQRGGGGGQLLMLRGLVKKNFEKQINKSEIES